VFTGPNSGISNLKAALIFKCIDEGSNEVLLHRDEIPRLTAGNKYAIQKRMSQLVDEGFMESLPEQTGVRVTLNEKYFIPEIFDV
jgi:hypothetical protein